VFAVIHDSTNRRFRTRGDFYQIQLLRGRLVQCILQADNPYLLTVHIDQPNFGSLDLLIDPGALLAALVASTLNVVNLNSVLDNEATPRRPSKGAHCMPLQWAQQPQTRWFEARN